MTDTTLRDGADDEPVLDRAALDAVAALLAPAALATHVDRLIGRADVLRDRLLRPGAADPDGTLVDDVHALAGGMGMLGFARVAAAAWAFEAAVAQASPEIVSRRADMGVALEQALAVLREERDRRRP